MSTDIDTTYLGGEWVTNYADLFEKLPIGEIRRTPAGTRTIVSQSVMPTIPSNNTLATVYAIAERGADLIRQS
jgi:hypothetical protein